VQKTAIKKLLSLKNIDFLKKQGFQGMHENLVLEPEKKKLSLETVMDSDSPDHNLTFP
jgi:hypothetical protein